MAQTTPDDLWRLVVEAGLRSPTAAAALRAEHDAAAGAAAADPRRIAAWLAGKGVLTRWQAGRIAAGDTGRHLGGESLAAELRRRGPLPLREVGEIALVVARAVAELHAAGDVHGGLSLDAIVREPSATGGRLRLEPLSLAGDPHRAAASDADGRGLPGSRAAFVAPELAAGAACDARSDVYAIGCLLHALVTGTPPGWNGDPQAAREKAAAGGPGRLPAAVAPAELATLVDYMTATDPRDRYPDAAEAADAIATTFGFTTRRVAGMTAAAARAGDPQAARTAALEAARRRARQLRWVGGIGAAALVAAALALVAVNLPGPAMPARPLARRDERRAPQGKVAAAPLVEPATKQPGTQAPPPAAVTPADVTPAAVKPADATPPDATRAADASRPWASPTAGQPPVLAWLPAGSQVILVARPADLLADEEGRLLVRALGPRAADGLAAVAEMCGADPEAIETLQVGWQLDASGEPLVGWNARLVEGRSLPDDEAFRARTWGVATKTEREGETIHTGPACSAWAPASAGGRLLVVAPAASLADMVAADAPDPPALALPGDLERLAASLDGRRHLSILASPAALRSGGHGVFAGQLEPLAAGVDALLGESVQAAALSIHCGADFYTELTALPTVDVPAATLAARLAGEIDRLPPVVKAFCTTRDFHPYGRSLVTELPTMVRALAAHVRAGAEGRLAVVNAYLPRHAGHNIALAAELALAQGRAVPQVAAAAAVGVADRLRQPVTIVFEKDTLEKAIQMLGDGIGMPIEILGPDLQVEGITKNQSFRLEERERPAAEVLRTILAKASPDGKLVYVIRNVDGGESIAITTRAAAERRGDPLPAEFRQAGAPAKGRP